MMLSRDKEEIVRYLTEAAEKTWGTERAGVLKAEIGKVADWISIVLSQPLSLEDDEPDYLVAPAFDWGVK